MSTHAERMKASNHAVFLIAEWVHAQGYTVTVPRQIIAPNGASFLDYDDGGVDIYCIKDGDLRCINGKHINTAFTGPNDWPHEVVFVNRTEPIDRAGDQQSDYMIVSADYSTIAIIYGKTREHWKAIEKFNRVENKKQWFYHCPLPFVKFTPFELFS